MGQQQLFKNLITQMRKIPCFHYDSNHREWRPYTGNKSVLNTSALRIATFNVLMDCENFLSDALSRSQERFKKIVKIIDELSADIIGLNEVTHSCLQFLLEDPIIRRDYFISDNLVSKKKTVNLTLNDTDHWMGNVLLCKYPMNELYVMDFDGKRVTGLRRAPVVAVFMDASTQRKVAFCALHLIARHDLKKQRKSQLKRIRETIDLDLLCDDTFLFGDFNLHSEDESPIIPSNSLIDLWTETCGSDPGYTLDSVNNSLINAKYLFLNRLYFEAYLKHKGQMRLDRITMSSRSKDVWHPVAPMKIFANELVYQHKWDYLYPSDHYGLYIDMTTDKTTKFILEDRDRAVDSKRSTRKNRITVENTIWVLYFVFFAVFLISKAFVFLLLRKRV